MSIFVSEPQLIDIIGMQIKLFLNNFAPFGEVFRDFQTTYGFIFVQSSPGRPGPPRSHGQDAKGWQEARREAREEKGKGGMNAQLTSKLLSKKFPSVDLVLTKIMALMVRVR